MKKKINSANLNKHNKIYDDEFQGLRSFAETCGDPPRPAENYQVPYRPSKPNETNRDIFRAVKTCHNL